MTRQSHRIPRGISRGSRHQLPVAFSFSAELVDQSKNGNQQIAFHFAKPRQRKVQRHGRRRHSSHRLCSRNVPAPPRARGCATEPELPRLRSVRSTFAYHRIAIVLSGAGISADAIRTFATCSWKNVGNKKNSRCRNEKPPRPSAIPPLRKITDWRPRPRASHTSDHSLKPALSIFRTAN